MSRSDRTRRKTEQERRIKRLQFYKGLSQKASSRTCQLSERSEGTSHLEERRRAKALSRNVPGVSEKARRGRGLQGGARKKGE